MERFLCTARFDSPIGELSVTSSERGLCYVSLPRASGRGLAGWQRRHAPGVRGVAGYEPNRAAIAQIVEFLAGKRERFELALDLRATPFQRAVYAVVASIGYGECLSYAEVAARIGRPSAVRAVAQALRWNPLPIVVPCHRVIGASGALTGYAGDRIDLKRRLLALEGVLAERAGAAVRVTYERMYLLAPGEVEYCVPTCPSVEGTDPQRLIRIGSRERAEAGGLMPCTTCRPDLHPLER